MEIEMGDKSKHSVIFIYNAGKTKLVISRSLTIIFDKVSMGTDGLDLKQQTLQVSFWRGIFLLFQNSVICFSAFLSLLAAGKKEYTAPSST